MNELFLKLLIFIALPLVTCTSASAQVSFGYDAAGNRISRTIVLAKTLTKAATTDSIKPFTEMQGELQVKIYPNPTKGKLTVEITGSTRDVAELVAIYGIQGQLLLQQAASSSHTDLDISGQPAGTYILRINAGQKTTYWRIIKE